MGARAPLKQEGEKMNATERAKKIERAGKEFVKTCLRQRFGENFLSEWTLETTEKRILEYKLWAREETSNGFRPTKEKVESWCLANGFTLQQMQTAFQIHLPKIAEKTGDNGD
jgi:hypothetical protein